MKPVTYPRKKIIEVLRTLEEIVVSLDRLGSAEHEMSKEEADATLANFIRRHDIFRKTARARRILSDAFSRKAGKDGMDELERKMQDVPYWKPRGRER